MSWRARQTLAPSPQPKRDVSWRARQTLAPTEATVGPWGNLGSARFHASFALAGNIEAHPGAVWPNNGRRGLHAWSRYSHEASGTKGTEGTGVNAGRVPRRAQGCMSQTLNPHYLCTGTMLHISQNGESICVRVSNPGCRYFHGARHDRGRHDGPRRLHLLPHCGAPH